MSDRASNRGHATVQELTDDGCLQRLAAATVGRIGYVSPQGLQIIPLNYRLAGSTLMLATTPGSAFAQLSEMGAQVAFEVDYHSPDFNLAWSVLMHGRVQQLDTAGRQRLAELRPPLLSWLGEAATQHLSFIPQHFSGRVLQHHP